MDTQPEKKTSKENPDQALLERVKDRYETMYEADQENRRWAMEDLKFVNVPGEQWDHNMKNERGNRPCYEFNRLRISCKRIINDMRANRPAPKVRAVEDGDTEMASIHEGLIRNIWSVSDADTIIDQAGEYQVAAGMAGWRVSTEYSDDTAFDQDICIKPIINPFTLYCDPSAKDQLKRDAADWLLTEKIPYADYEARYGEDTDKSDFQESIEFDDDDDWQDEERVRIAEYWWKEPISKELWMVRNEKTGEMMVVDSESDEAEGITKEAIEKRRNVMTYKIMWCVASGQKVLEGPTEWAGREFPFVMVYGEHVHVDGRPRWWGLPRFAKDAQQNYNISRTAIAETIHQAPKSFMWATAKQAQGQTSQWKEAHKKNLPFMVYNSDPDAPGAPQRVGGPDIPVALMQQAMLDAEDLKAVTGVFDASLGKEGNEKSGRAIYARQQQGEIATFNFQDNMSKAVQRTAEIILDLVPEIYDTERELRILGTDGAEDYVLVNEVVTAYDGEEPYQTRINDLSAGKYDVTVSVGPSFSTLRQEAAETYGSFAQQYPELMAFAGDLVFKSMDLPYADDIADRIKAMLPPQIQQQMSQGKDLPPEVMQAMQNAEFAMQQVQEYAQMVQAAGAEIQEDSAELEKLKATVEVSIANLDKAKAEFDAHIASETARLIEKGADLTVKAADVKVAAKDAEVLTEEATEAISAVEVGDMAYKIDGVLAGFMEAADAAMGELAQQSALLEKQANRRPVGGNVRRDGGKLVADVSFDDGSTRSVAAVRDKGGLRIVEPDSEVGSEA